MTSRQSAADADHLVRRYLAQLDAALQGVDASRRDEILTEVRGHIQEGRAELDPDDAISVRNLLSRVGDPAAIAAEAGASPPGSRRWDVWAPWLIIFGPVASGLGWVAGVLILWTSPAWNQRDKLIATFVPPVGLVALFFGLVTALGGRRITLPLGAAIVLAVAGLAAHVLPPVHLMRVRSQQRGVLGVLLVPRPQMGGLPAERWSSRCGPASPEPRWLAGVAAAVRDHLRGHGGDLAIGHGDWHSGNLCWHGARLVAVHDWDSVICQPEPAIAGLAAVSFCGIDDPATMASVKDSAAFLDAYQHARGRRWTPGTTRHAGPPGCGSARSTPRPNPWTVIPG